MTKFFTIAILSLWMATDVTVGAAEEGVLGHPISHAKEAHRSLQEGMDEPILLSQTSSPTISPSDPTASDLGFSLTVDTEASTVTAICPSSFSAQQSSTTALMKQIFQFQYYMYTDADRARKIAELDQRYVQPLAAQVLSCSSARNDYAFEVQGIVVNINDGTEAGNCEESAAGTPCILAVGSFEALIRLPERNNNRHRRKLMGQDLSNPELIIAFGGVLGTLFGGTELLDEEIESLAFDGFINGFTPGNDNNVERDPSNQRPYPGIVARSPSDDPSNETDTTLIVAVAAAAVVVAVSMALVLVLVHRRKRRIAKVEGFHDLDSESWGFDDSKPTSKTWDDQQDSSDDSVRDMRKLETTLQPSFDLDCVNDLFGVVEIDDEMPSDEEQDRDPRLSVPQYFHIQRRPYPSIHSHYDGFSLRSDITPDTVEL